MRCATHADGWRKRNTVLQGTRAEILRLRVV
jgi:hypothetical protein